jgi:hypothetical protein
VAAFWFARLYAQRRRRSENKAFDKATFFLSFVLDTSPEFLAELLREWIPKIGQGEKGRGKFFESYVCGNAQQRYQRQMGIRANESG